jgi:hypothetical protein
MSPQTLTRACFSSLYGTAIRPERSDTNLKTPCFGQICRSMIQRSFIGSRSEDALLEERFPRLYSAGPLPVRTLWASLSPFGLRSFPAAPAGVYERFGFRFHSDKQVGPYFVARYEYDVLAMAPLSRQ